MKLRKLIRESIPYTAILLIAAPTLGNTNINNTHVIANQEIEKETSSVNITESENNSKDENSVVSTEIQTTDTNEVVTAKEPETKNECIQEETTQPVYEKTLWYTLTESAGIMYANRNVNIRTAPTADSEKISVLLYGQKITKTGICDNGWTQVKYEDRTGYIFSDYLQDTKPETPQQTTTENVIEYSGIIKKIGNISNEKLWNIDKNYYLIPENVRTRLENDGWNYFCNSEDFGAEYGFSFEILALTIYDRKTIYISDKTSAEKSILHEVGHALDYTCGFVSDRKEFSAIYDAEKNVFCSTFNVNANGHNASSTIEYFATSYHYYITNPELLKENCPKTYEYIKKYENSI